MSAFSDIGASTSLNFISNVFGAASSALVLSNSSYLAAAGASAPAALPSGNASWSASAWVKCVAPATYAAVLEWGAAGDSGGWASSQALAHDVSGIVAGVVTTLAGSGSTAFADGTGASAKFSNPIGVAVNQSGGIIVVAETSNNRIRLVTPAGVVTTLASSGSSTFADGTGTSASFAFPYCVAVIPSSSIVVVADTLNNRIRLVTPGGVATMLAGSGPSAFADGIRLVTPAGVVTTLAGSCNQAFADGAALSASFYSPRGVAVIPTSGIIVVADYYNNRIRLITPAGVVTTLACSGNQAFADGTGAVASFYYPFGVAVSPSSGLIVVADQENNRIRLLALPALLALQACDATWHHVALTYSASPSSNTPLSACHYGSLVSQQNATITLPAAPSSTLRIGRSGIIPRPTAACSSLVRSASCASTTARCRRPRLWHTRSRCC